MALEVCCGRSDSIVKVPPPSRVVGSAGFAPELASCMSKSTLIRATGNSFTVPVVVDVFQRCMDAISYSPILGVDILQRPRKRADGLVAHLATRRRANELRGNIALLDAEMRLEEMQFKLLTR